MSRTNCARNLKGLVAKRRNLGPAIIHTTMVNPRKLCFRNVPVEFEFSITRYAKSKLKETEFFFIHQLLRMEVLHHRAKEEECYLVVSLYSA